MYCNIVNFNVNEKYSKSPFIKGFKKIRSTPHDGNSDLLKSMRDILYSYIPLLKRNYNLTKKTFLNGTGE